MQHLYVVLSRYSFK